MRLHEVRAALAGQPDLSVSPAGRIVARVSLRERGHVVRITEVDGRVRLSGRVVHTEGMEVRTLQRTLAGANARAELLGFVRDEDGWLVVRADLEPDADADELRAAVRRVARTADRWELLWTGEDGE